MRAQLLAGLAFGAALIASAQVTYPPPTIRSLSLRECLELALAHNLQLRIEQLTADIARYDLKAAYGVYSPVFAFRAKHNFVSQPGNFDPKKTGTDFPYEMNADTLGPSLEGRLPIGLSYQLAAYAEEENVRTVFLKNIPGGIRETNNYFSEATLQLEQHLLRDSWIDAEREQILLRRKDLRISQQTLRFQIMSTILAVELSYYDLIAAREDVRVQEKALQLRQQLVAETHRRVQVGDLPPLDADQAETQLQNTVTALSAAREAVTSRQNVLKGLLTDEFQDWVDIDLQPAESLFALPAEVSRTDSFQKALRERPDLIQARIEIEKRDVMVKFRKNQIFPNLDLIGRYGGLGVDPDAGRSINNALDFINPEYSYGVVLSLPLDNLSERNNYRTSKASREIAKLELKRAEEQVLLQIADLANRVQTRWIQVGSTHKARTYAEAALAAEEKKLQNGLSTAFIVLQLQETLTAARNAEILALADYNKALAQLAFAEGRILEKHHLSVEVK